MNPEHKKYILENINKKSIKELAGLGYNVRQEYLKFLEALSGQEIQ